MKGYHIIAASGRLNYKDKRRVKPGRWYTAYKHGRRAPRGTHVEVCAFGMHASPTLYDVLRAFRQISEKFPTRVRLCYVRLVEECQLRTSGAVPKMVGRRRMVVRWSKPIRKSDLRAEGAPGRPDPMQILMDACADWPKPKADK